jgi:hypothetical protein
MLFGTTVSGLGRGVCETAMALREVPDLVIRGRIRFGVRSVNGHGRWGESASGSGQADFFRLARCASSSSSVTQPNR